MEGDHTLLATAEQGEDAAKAAYEKALKEKLPGDILDVLRTQQAHIIQSHNKVQNLRGRQGWPEMAGEGVALLRQMFLNCNGYGEMASW